MRSTDDDFDAESEREISELLAASPRPTMPPEILSRIEAALAAEAEHSVGSTSPSRSVGLWPVLAAVAAVAVLAGFMLIPRLSEPGPTSAQQVPAAAPVSPSPACTALGTTAEDRSTPVTDSGTAYTASALPVQAARLLRATPPPCSSDVQPQLAGTASAQPLRDCVMAVAKGRSVAAVDLGWYEQRKSVTVVLLTPREALAVDCDADPVTVLARAALP